MKKFTLIMLVLVVIVLTATACKLADVDPIVQGDAEFDSMTFVIEPYYGIVYNVTAKLVFKVKTYTTMRLEGEVFMDGSGEYRLLVINVPNTNGQERELKENAEFTLKAGNYEFFGGLNLKRADNVVVLQVIIPDTPVIVP